MIAAPTTPDGFLVENTYPYLEQPDGTYLLPERYAPTYIPSDYALEEHHCDGDEYYLYRKDDGFLFWSGSYITFNQRYPTSTIVFDLEDVALEEIEVEASANASTMSLSGMKPRGPDVVARTLSIPH